MSEKKDSKITYKKFGFNSNVFDENFCIKCHDPKLGQEKLLVVTRGA